MKRERGKRLSLKRLCHLRIDLFTDTVVIHIELIGFKEYYGMPLRHKDDPLYSHQYLRSLSGQFLSFSRKRLKWEKKIVVPSLDVITNAFFPRNIHWTSLFAGKERENTERVPPGHPIILLKSNKFNMADVSVKRCTGLINTRTSRQETSIFNWISIFPFKQISRLNCHSASRVTFLPTVYQNSRGDPLCLDS